MRKDVERALFRRVPETALYLAEGYGNTGVLLRGPVTEAPETLDVRQAFECYIRSILLVFPGALPESPTEQYRIGKLLSESLAKEGDDVRLAWVGDVTGKPQVALSVRIKFNFRERSWRILRRQAISLCPNLELVFAAGTSVTASATGLSFVYPKNKPAKLTYDDQRTRRRAEFTLNEPTGIQFLSDERPNGAWDMPEFAVDSQAAQVLRPAVRFYVPCQGHADSVEALVYQLFDLTGQAKGTQYQLHGTIDFWGISDPRRTRFALNAAAPLTTYLRTAAGGAVHLRLREGSALVLAGDLESLSQPGHATENPRQSVYFTPEGPWTVEIDGVTGITGRLPPHGPPFDRTILAGSSGVEYFSLAHTESAEIQPTTILTFVPGQPAFAPLASPDKEHSPAPPRYRGLTGLAKTSWAYLGSGAETAEVLYFAQPESGALFGADNTTEQGSAVFLGYRAPVAGRLPPFRADDAAPGEAPSKPFPLVPMPGVTELQEEAFALEEQILAPQRREAVPGPRLGKGWAVTPENGEVVTTPQGLIVTIRGDQWERLEIAQSTPTGDAGGGTQPTTLHNVRGSLKLALQTNQLFLAISDREKLLEACDLAYRLDRESQFQELINVDGMPAEAVNYLQKNMGKVDWPVIGEAPFLQLVGGVLTKGGFQQAFEQFGLAIAHRSVLFSVTAAGWKFDLSPYTWGDNGTVLLFKFLPQSLAELAEDSASWTLPQAFNVSTQDIRQRIADMIQEGHEAGIDPFVKIAQDPSWTGILALRIPAPLTGLPDQLKSLAAGIDPQKFRAYFVSVPVTPISVRAEAGSGKAALQAQPSAFGAMLSYHMTEEASKGVASPYDYLVLDLRMVISNGAVREFSSTVAFFVTQLFGEPAMLSQGQYIPLDGSVQKEGGGDTYVFLNRDPAPLTIDGTVLKTATFDRVQFYTVQKTEKKENDPALVRCRFLLDGVLTFRALEGFDAFSFGPNGKSAAEGGKGLRVNGLAVDMSFDLSVPTHKEFGFDVSAATIDEGASRARPGSLYANFPLRLKGIMAGSADNSPERTCFMPVDIPTAAEGLGDQWFGLQFGLDLGSPGALAPQIDFNARILLAWSPKGEDQKVTPRIFVGLALPGVQGGERAIPLQGVIKLGFGGVGFVVSGGEAEQTYLLQLRKIALQILGISFPPGVQIDCFLFGDPSGKDREAAGWYAAYVAEGADVGANRLHPIPGREFASPLQKPVARSSRMPAPSRGEG